MYALPPSTNQVIRTVEYLQICEPAAEVPECRIFVKAKKRRAPVLRAAICVKNVVGANGRQIMILIICACEFASAVEYDCKVEKKRTLKASTTAKYFRDLNFR